MRIEKVYKVFGNKLTLRNVEPTDAEFILSLRTDPEKSQYLSKVTNDIEAQRKWIAEYQHSDDQAYFIIEAAGQQVGTVRLYDPQRDSFCWGSWILTASAPQNAVVETTLLVYRYALDYLGFARSHFDVRKSNVRVWAYHERCGARRIGEDDRDYFYEIDTPSIRGMFEKYVKYLPDGIKVEKGWANGHSD